MSSNVFNRVGGARFGRSVFNLSYEKKLTCDMGKLIPIMCDEVVPGDVLDIANHVVVRLTPLIAPMLHEVNVYLHYFFVPYRLLDEDFEEFITGGEDGQSAVTLPTWNVTDNAIGSLWDHLGFPTGITLPANNRPMSFPRDAYNFIYNEYYRDQNLISEVALTSEDIQHRAWEKDYFTASLPWQQRGTAPALPISGTTNAEWDQSVFTQTAGGTSLNAPDTASNPTILVNSLNGPANVKGAFDDNTVDLSAATTFDISDLRLAFQIQRWLERNARAGARYTEFLRAHFGVAPRDERLDRPEYIGGSKAPIVVSEVLQTSSTDATTPQGNLAGHGLTSKGRYIGKYRVKEFGLIMGIMSIMPRSAYSQGIDKQWLRETKYDFAFPEFVNLSEQAVKTMELYATAVEATNDTLFGYIGRYDEMRVKRNMLAGEMRAGGTYDYWTLGRDFSGTPLLNQSFIECDPSKRTFAVQDEDTCIVQVANILKAVRPIPIMAEPGLIDHV